MFVTVASMNRKLISPVLLYNDQHLVRIVLVPLVLQVRRGQMNKHHPPSLPSPYKGNVIHGNIGKCDLL